jgi:hypothetical protein
MPIADVPFLTGKRGVGRRECCLGFTKTLSQWQELALVDARQSCVYAQLATSFLRRNRNEAAHLELKTRRRRDAGIAGTITVV